MRDFDENNITAAVIDRYKNTPDPRLKSIMTSLVQHLHDFVRDVEPTEAEWGQAIDYLTRTGKLCTDKRQEFILLSDTLGVSMLVFVGYRIYGRDGGMSASLERALGRV